MDDAHATLARPGHDALSIRVDHDRIPADWDRLVAADPAADYFHTVAWWRVCVGAARCGRVVAVSARHGETLVGGIAAVEERLGPLRRIFALPLGTHGGPLIARGAPGGWTRHPGAPGHAAWHDDRGDDWMDGTPLGGQLARALFQIPGIAEIHLVDASGAAGEDLAYLPGTECHFPVRRLVDLDWGDAGELWKRMDARCRNKIRKARKAGLRTERVSDPERRGSELRRLIDATEEARGFRPNIPAAVVDALARAPRSRGGEGIDLWLAHAPRSRGGEGGPPLAAALNLVHGARVQNFLALSTAEGRSLAAHNLLHWSAMEQAVAESRRLFDLGCTDALPGVDAFKASLGASAVRLHAWRRLRPPWRWLQQARGRL